MSCLIGSEQLTTRCRSWRKLLVSLCDEIVMIALVLIQGTVLNFYIIRHYSSSISPYFLFVADSLVVITFIVALAKSYAQSLRVTAHQNDVVAPPPPNRQRPTLMTFLGHLPLFYLSWLFYVSVLVMKIGVIFESELVLRLKVTERMGPQLLQVSMATSGLIFLLLAEGHNWNPRGSPRYSYITSICAKTGIEIFDSVSFLSILMAGGPSGLPEWLREVILIIAAANFLLPTFLLYQLGLPDKVLGERTDFVNVAYYVFHASIIDIPFLVVRLYLWFEYREPASMFLMKNILNIVLTTRRLLPEFVELSRNYLSPLLVNSCCGRKDRQETDKESGKFEEITLKDREKGDAL